MTSYIFKSLKTPSSVEFITLATLVRIIKEFKVRMKAFGAYRQDTLAATLPKAKSNVGLSIYSYYHHFRELSQSRSLRENSSCL